MNFYDELCRLNAKKEIFSVAFYEDRESVCKKCCLNLKSAADWFYEHDGEFDYFIIDFCTMSCDFVTFENISELHEYNNNQKLTTMDAFKQALDYIDNSTGELFDGRLFTIDDGGEMVISDMGYYPQSEDEYLNYEPYHNGWERCEQDRHWFRKGERHVIVSPRKLWEY